MQTNDKQTILMASFALALMLVAMPLIFAEENETPMLISANPGAENSNQTLDSETMDDINDDLNESVNGFDVGRARVGLWFTFNQEKKAEKELRLARLRLIQARIAAKNNNTVAMEKALEAHNRIIERVQKRMESLDGKSTKEGAQKSAEGLIALERAIQVHEARIQKLNELLVNNANLSEEQITKIQEKIDKAENNTAKLEALELAKKEKIKVKLMAINNMTEEEAQDIIESLEDAQNLSVIKKLIAEKRVFEAEKRLEELKEKVAEAETEGKNMTKAAARIVELEENIKEAKALIEEGKYDEAIDKLRSSEVSKQANKEFREQAREQIMENRGEAKEANQQIREQTREQIKENMEQAREANKQAMEKAREQIKENREQFGQGKNLTNRPSLEQD